jgi:hypothetical protein
MPTWRSRRCLGEQALGFAHTLNCRAYIELCRSGRHHAARAWSPRTERGDPLGESEANLYNRQQCSVTSAIMLTDVFHIQSLQTSINSIKNVLSTKPVVVGVMVLLFQNLLVDSDTLNHESVATSPILPRLTFSQSRATVPNSLVATTISFLGKLNCLIALPVMTSLTPFE